MVIFKEEKSDIFYYQHDEKYSHRYICILTNCVLDNQGELVMGGGQAAEAKWLAPSLPEVLGELTRTSYSHVMKAPEVYLHPPAKNTSFINFPTKYHFSERSNVSLITRNMIELATLARHEPVSLFTIPRPGCGLGGLDWDTEVLPLAIKFFDVENILVTSK